MGIPNATTIDVSTLNLTSSDTPTLPEVEALKKRLHEADIPQELKQKAQHQIDRIQMTLKYGGNLKQMDITEKYIDWITKIPWTEKSEDMLDIQKAKEMMDQNHYGLQKVKDRVLEYVSTVILRKKSGIDTSHAPILFFVGLAGTGKTTFAKSVAESLDRVFVRIPFGGLSSALDLRGQSKTNPEAEPGAVIKALRQAKVRNPVILLDELDRVSGASRAEIMGVLLELLDPGQNIHFTDYFIDYPYNLGDVLFVCTGNNTTNVATAVLDRLEVIQMPSYTDEEKITIGKQYILPKMIKDSGLKPEQIVIDEKLWAIMVRPLGFEPGIRSLQRMIENIVRKVVYRVVSKQGETFYINANNYREFADI